MIRWFHVFQTAVFSAAFACTQGWAESPAPAPAVTFTHLPQPLQVYPRDLKSNKAFVPIAGTVTTPGYETIVVRIQKEGDAKPYLLKQRLRYKNGVAPFTLFANIAAELKNYAFSVNLNKGSQTCVVTNVADVVAGDIFLINGQSNAEARGFNGSANTNRGAFVRSFGSRVHNPSVAATLNWCPAEGDQVEGPGAVGQWGLRLGRLMVDTFQVPVAILNGALGGQAIGHYQRDAKDPQDLNSNYGRLLLRCRAAGVTNSIRAIFWYQGESDSGNADVHEKGFLALYQAWKNDYPSIRKVYVMQVRVGCGVDKGNVELRDRQRRWPGQFPGIAVMSPNGINAHDGCHYAYEGYAEIANRLFALAARDLYGQKSAPGIEAPDMQRAFFSKPDHTEITLCTRDPAEALRFDAGAQADFVIEAPGNVQITGGSASGNRIILTLSADAGQAAAVCYTGHSGGGPWVTNTRGIGLLAGRVHPIEAAAPAGR